MAARYIFDGRQFNGLVTKLSGTSRTLAQGIIKNPEKMESLIGMVRNLAPLTSPQTVAKVNTYLPAVEKASTLLSMYSFLNRAQNYRPITALDAKTPLDKVTALLKNGNIPVAKLLAKPLITGNMEKIMSALAMNLAKSGGLNEMFSSLNKGDNNKISEMLSSLSGNKDNTDLNALLDTFMPIINNVMSSSNKPEEEKEPSVQEIFKSADFDHTPTPPQQEKNQKNEKHVQKPIRIRQRRRYKKDS
ncbi:MAG TPA: hypothetical protein PLV23_01615 [Sedimentibacter sp.]|jgi:hypothetical protein|nr:hypothetical protein [Sedimentibacter sp.]HOK50243.1 hypothetical protein [Sedimentibacter sp.]HOW22307.1 hypothetical protein [Sedimentibacter sp.]HRC81304.1 hypothetical protein [Sedimentibacter sp.]